VELTGLISDRMKVIDNDIKKVQDELTEHRNNFAAMSKKEGTNFLTQDVAEAIYGKGNLNVNDHFVEKLGSETFSTVIAVVNKTKIPAFLEKYEKVIPWNE
jgi:V-ATPase subunit C